jgi:hypothetical protein
MVGGRGARAVSVGALAALATQASEARADGPIFWDGRDPYTLLDHHPIDRQVVDQRTAQPDRLLPSSDRFAALADVGIGTQQPVLDGQQTRFHGWFVADTYLGAVIVPNGLEANANILMLNPSASDGYRESAAIVPGVALHAHFAPFRLGGDPVRFDALGTDLGPLTIGRGLLLEQTPVEGVMAGVTWRDAQLRYVYAGRALWDDDDFIAGALSLFGGRAELTLADWQRATGVGTITTTWYATAALDQPIGQGLRLAAEVAARADGPAPAALVRLDYVAPKSALPIALHSGYQMRVYAHGFSPRADLTPPTWRWNTPAQEDVYVTNPIEYYALARDYDVWSHTLVLESRAKLGRGFELFGAAEELLRIAYLRTEAPARIASDVKTLELFYRAGVRFFPWEGLRHRASFLFTNKLIETGNTVTTPIVERFTPHPAAWLLTLDAYL